MAVYKYANFLSSNNGTAFDTLYTPGDDTEFSGIYRCTSCGHEMTSVKDHPLPPQNHQVHSPLAGPILWQLIVATQTR